MGGRRRACRSATSLPVIQGLIGAAATSAVRCPAGSLVAWALEVEPLCFGMLFVLEPHRRRGLARAVCCDLLRKLEARRRAVADAAGSRAAGAAVYCYVVDGNAGSAALMRSLGLRETGVFSWLAFARA